jgi:DNA-binding Lrp family transcriptional regulator
MSIPERARAMADSTHWNVWDRLLGTMPDGKLASLAGCSEDTLIYRRRKLGIAAFTQSQIQWEKWDGMLGKSTDQDIAQKIGCAVKTVEKRRRGLGIASYRDSGRKSRNPRRIDWTEWDKKLGKSPDGEAAKLIGCSVRTVEKRRKKLRIPAFIEHPHIDWHEWDETLGKSPDRETASLIGCSLIAVEQRRKRLGIRAFTKNSRIDWKLWDTSLGKTHDREAAELIGCSMASVLRRRKKLKIKAFERGTAKEPAKSVKRWNVPLDNATVTI